MRDGEWASGRSQGSSEFVPKGLEDSARGFNPGLPTQQGPALKGRQMLLPVFASMNETGIAFLPPLQGGAVLLSVPGVKTPG